jgi:hypothetical protein
MSLIKVKLNLKYVAKSKNSYGWNRTGGKYTSLIDTEGEIKMDLTVCGKDSQDLEFSLY